MSYTFGLPTLGGVKRQNPFHPGFFLPLHSCNQPLVLHEWVWSETSTKKWSAKRMREFASSSIDYEVMILRNQILLTASVIMFPAKNALILEMGWSWALSTNATYTVVILPSPKITQPFYSTHRIRNLWQNDLKSTYSTIVIHTHIPQIFGDKELFLSLTMTTVSSLQGQVSTLACHHQMMWKLSIGMDIRYL